MFCGRFADKGDNPGNNSNIRVYNVEGDNRLLSPGLQPEVC